MAANRPGVGIRSGVGLLPLYPSAFAVAFILDRYLATGGYLYVVLRPLLVLLAVATLIQLVLSLATRGRHLGAFVTTLGLATILDPILAMVIVVLGGAVLLGNAVKRHRAGPLDWHRLTPVFNAIALVTVVSTAVAIGLRAGPPFPPSPAARMAAAEGAPDIYVILLDEYPRRDTLAEVFGYDNGPFIDALERLGFEEAERSHSNYNATSPTFTSLFNARHVDEVLGDGDRGIVSSAFLQPYTDRGAALTWLRKAGYGIVSMPSGISWVDLAAVDAIIDPGHVNSFELSVMKAGFLPRVFSRSQAEWIYEQQRDRIHATFQALAAIPRSAVERPQFVFAHVMSPHAPIVFDAEGGPVGPPDCLPATCGPWDGRREPADNAATIEQMQYLNSLVLDAVSEMVTMSPEPPVIVLVSDHGSRYSVDDPDEMLRNFFIAFTPGRPGLFPDDVTPINLIPRLLNAYVGADHPFATEESYMVDLDAVPTKGYLPFVEWPQT